MFKIKIEISKILGLLLIAPCFYFSTVLLEMMIWETNEFGGIQWNIELIIITISTIIGFATSLGLMIKLSWSRFLFAFLLTALLIVLFIMTSYTEQGMTLIGLSICYGLFYLGLMMLLFHEVTNKEFGKIVVSDDYEDILDL